MYIRHNKDNQPISPQPGFTTVIQFGGNEGWTTITYEDWNSDYIRHNENNQPIGVGTYQRYDENNQPIGVGTYQRHDENNHPILL
jgi:hypothetical protein